LKQNTGAGYFMKTQLKLLLLSLAFMGQLNTVFAKKHGQEAIDSLLRELATAKEDTNKVNTLYSLSINYLEINPGEAAQRLQQTIDLATKLGWDNGMAKGNLVLGVVNRRMGDFKQAKEHINRGLQLYTKLGDKKNIAAAYINLANVYADDGDNPHALGSYFKALKIYEELDDKLSIARYSGNIGLIYSNLENEDKALEYYFKALKIYEETGDKHGLGALLGNIGLACMHKGEYNKALEYYFKAVKIDEEEQDRHDQAITTGNIGHTYVKLRDYARGIAYIEQALKMDEELEDKNFIAMNLQYLGEAYVSSVQDSNSRFTTGERNMRLGKAIAALHRGIEISREIELPDGLQNCYAHIAAAYRLLGDYKHAMPYMDSFYAIRDSTYSNDNKVKLANLATKREEELKEKQIALNKLAMEKKRDERIFFGIGSGLLLVIISGLFFSRRAVQKEKDISENLLLNILPEEVAEELKEKGSADAKMIDEVTVLFTDFKGFTQLSEKLSPQELVAEINACFSEFDHIMYRHSVEKIKTIGDAYMAAGGLPTPNSTHAADVVKAAIEIQQYMHRHKAERQAEGKLFFEIRIGVHTGPVVAGIVGIKKFQYDIWGDTVNTASRMESSGAPGEINISQATYELVKDKFTCVYRGEVAAKNKGMMKMYFVR